MNEFITLKADDEDFLKKRLQVDEVNRLVRLIDLIALETACFTLPRWMDEEAMDFFEWQQNYCRRGY